MAGKHTLAGTLAAAALVVAAGTTEAPAQGIVVVQPITLTDQEREAGFSLITNETGRVYLTRKTYQSFCFDDDKYQLVVPINVNIDLKESRERGIEQTKQVLTALEGHAPKVLSEVGSPKLLMPQLAAGGLTISFVNQMRAFKQGVETMSGIHVTLTMHGGVVLATHCNPITDEESFAPVRDIYVEIVKGMQGAIQGKRQRGLVEALNPI